MTEANINITGELSEQSIETGLKQNPTLASMSTYDVDVPPAQNSPINIVNILPNVCLQQILREIDNVRDFYSAAKVCKWFQKKRYRMLSL